MGKNEKAWGIGFKRLIGDASLGEVWGIAVEDTNKQLHILGVNDVDTDWNLSADSYPAVYIHGSASATEYIKVFTDSTDAHFNVVGANLDIDVPSSSQVAIQVNDTDEYIFNATTLNLGSNTITNAGNITQLAGAKISGTSTVIDSTNAMTFQIGATDILAIDDAAITLAAASETAGQNVYIKAEDGGAGSTLTGGTGATIYIEAGKGGTTIAGTGTDGGDIQLTAGNAAAGSAAAAEGDPGDIILTPGVSEGTGTHGYVQIAGTQSWTANSTRIVAFGTTGPSSVGTNVAEWLTFMNEDGSTRYIPAWAD